MNGKRELHAEETARLFHPDLHEHNPEKLKTPDRVDRKIHDRIMDSRIIFEDGWVQWVTVLCHGSPEYHGTGGEVPF